MPLENRNDEKRRMTPTSIDSLPDDDLITILVKLPAQDLHDTGRLVCRRWSRLIRSPEFIQTHLQSSFAGVLIWCRFKDKKWSVFVGMSGGQIETYKLRYKLTDMILSSCNGLIMLYDHVSRRLFVANPITKQHFSIPLYREQTPPYNWWTCLGYVAVSKEYKVVHVDNQKECAILTLGVDDSWRPLPTGHLSNSILYAPLVTEGFVHWVSYHKDSLVTLNLETETISDILLPESLGWSHCFSGGKCLSFISNSQPGLCWEVWEMRPGPVEEWDKLSDIDLEDKVGILEKLSPTGECVLQPFGWIKYKEVFLFELCGPRTFVAYNICTREFETFELYLPSHIYRRVAHTNSLVCLDGWQV